MKRSIAYEVEVSKTSRTLVGILATGLFLAVCAFSPNASATPVYTLLQGGNNPAQASAFPTGPVSMVASNDVSFSVSTPDGPLAGNVLSLVLSGDTSNPYGGLTFTYQLFLSPAAVGDSASAMTVGSYGGFDTDVSYKLLLGTDIAPSNFTRSLTGNGSTIRFLWSNNGGLQPGQNGAEVIVQTDAHSFQETLGGVIDSQTVNVETFAPVPEPGIGSLLATSLGALFIFRRRGSK